LKYQRIVKSCAPIIKTISSRYHLCILCPVPTVHDKISV